MAKKITKRLKLVLVGGRATPAPPLGPTLGQAGINIGDFVTKFNVASKNMMGETVPASVSVYEDRTYAMDIKTGPASEMILKAIGVEKGSGKNKVSKAGKISKAQIKQIAEKKLNDLNAHDVDAAMKIIEGTARSMGIEVK